MAETAEEKKKREKAEVLAGLKRRADEGEKEREIVAGRGSEDMVNTGDSRAPVKQGGPNITSTGSVQQRPTLKIAEPKPSPSPTSGAAQADALTAATKKSFDDMPMSELAKETSLGARAAYNRRKQKGDK